MSIFVERADFRNVPQFQLAAALGAKINQTAYKQTNETAYNFEWPFDSVEICEATMSYVIVVKVGEKRVTISDPREGFPSQQLINKLNLLRD